MTQTSKLKNSQSGKAQKSADDAFASSSLEKKIQRKLRGS